MNVSATVAAQYDCNTTCYAAFRTAISTDATNYGNLYDEDFYATASNFSTSIPGDILKYQPIDPKDLSDSVPLGATAYRFQYTSVDIRGYTVPVTGFVAFPYANQTNGHLFRTVAWSHGTSGVFKGCAPSVMPGLYAYGSWTHFIENGYAVVATDYAGLGNNYIDHRYVALAGHANDVFYSVAAVRKVFGASLTTEWISAGHSQGGGSVWSLAESPLVANTSSIAGKYLGTVAQAPGVLMGSTAIAALQTSGNSSSDATTSSGVFGVVGFAVLGFQNVYPNETFDWLNPTFRRRLDLSKKSQACYYAMSSLVADLEFNSVINLDSNATAEQLLRTISIIDELSAVSVSKSSQPVLVIQGLDDVAVLPTVVESAYKSSCQAGSEILLQLYPGLGHNSVVSASASNVLKWIDDRFTSKPTLGYCSKTTVESFDAAHMFAPED
ncbi:unnamed protein product [Alternaria alternata]